MKIKFKVDYAQTGNKKGDVIEIKGNKKSFAASNLAAVAEIVSGGDDEEKPAGSDKGKDKDKK